MVIVTIVPYVYLLITQGTDELKQQAAKLSDLLGSAALFLSIILSAILRSAKSKQFDRYSRLLGIEFFAHRINTLYGGNIQLQSTARHTINVDLNFRAKTSQDRMTDYIASQKDVSVVLAFLGRLNTIESFRLLFFLLIPVVLLFPCIDFGGSEGITYYQIIESFRIFEHLELLVTTGKVGDNFDPIMFFFLLLTLIIYLVYAIKFLKHLIGSTTAASRYRPLVEKNIFILGTKDNKKDSLFLFILLEFLRIIVRGGWLWLAIIIYITLAYPFNVLLNYNIIGMFENVGGISEVIEIISNFHSAIMENELINKLPLLLAGILFCLFYFMHLHKEMVKRNNPKFTAILDLD